MSHFYLTNLIIQQQTAARRSTSNLDQGQGQSPRSLRVINVSSSAYSRGSMAHLDEMTSHGEVRRGRVDDIYGSYADSKLAMMLFTTELNFRHTIDNVICLAVHPGSYHSVASLLHAINPQFITSNNDDNDCDDDESDVRRHSGSANLLSGRPYSQHTLWRHLDELTINQSINQSINQYLLICCC